MVSHAKNELPSSTGKMRGLTLLECLGPYLRRRMTKDHPRLKTTLDDVAHLAKRRSFQNAGQRFGEFRLAEERHMDFEDKTLFPLIERLTGPSENLETAKAEHDNIRRLLDVVGHALSSWSLPDFESAHVRLMRALAQHWDGEQELLGIRVNIRDQATRDEIVKALTRC
jgi:hypothetical protein